jgi:sugar lactone lactonase YvrE
MPTANYLPDVLETTEAERLATGFIFTEGPLWHPNGYWYFVDIRQNKLFRLTPGKEPEVVRNTNWRQRHDLRLAGPPRRVRGR